MKNKIGLLITFLSALVFGIIGSQIDNTYATIIFVLFILFLGIFGLFYLFNKKY